MRLLYQKQDIFSVGRTGDKEFSYQEIITKTERGRRCFRADDFQNIASQAGDIVAVPIALVVVK